MLDIIILVFLARHIGEVAKNKGLSVFNWRLYTVLAWLGGEIIGLIVGLSIFGQERLLMVMLVAFPCAIAGYHIVRNALAKKPDIFSDEINQVGDHLQ